MLPHYLRYGNLQNLLVLILADLISSGSKHCYLVDIEKRSTLNETLTSWLLQKDVYTHFSDLFFKYFFDDKIDSDDKITLEGASVLYELFYKENLSF